MIAQSRFETFPSRPVGPTLHRQAREGGTREEGGGGPSEGQEDQGGGEGGEKIRQVTKRKNPGPVILDQAQSRIRTWTTSRSW